MYISTHTHHETQQLYIIRSDIQYATKFFDPVCRPSSGCLENLSDYKVRVVLFVEGEEISSYNMNREISRS